MAAKHTLSSAEPHQPPWKRRAGLSCLPSSAACPGPGSAPASLHPPRRVFIANVTISEHFPNCVRLVPPRSLRGESHLPNGGGKGRALTALGLMCSRPAPAICRQIPFHHPARAPAVQTGDAPTLIPAPSPVAWGCTSFLCCFGFSSQATGKKMSKYKSSPYQAVNDARARGYLQERQRVSF